MKTVPHIPNLVVALVALATPFSAVAQDNVSVQPQAQPSAVPGLNDFSLAPARPTPAPTSAPTPVVIPRTITPPVVVPSVVATPTPRPTAAPTRAPAPRPSATPAPMASITPRPLPPVLPAPLPSAEPAPLATASAPSETPAATPTAATTTGPLAGDTGTGSVPWLWLVLGLVVIAALAGFIVYARRARAGTEYRPEDSAGLPVTNASEDVAERDISTSATVPTPTPTPVLAAPPVRTQSAGPRATLAFDLIPQRGGTNLLSTAVDYRIVLRNEGELAATGIRLDVRLLSAGQQHDALIATLFAAPIDQPITAPFELAPGMAVEMGGMAMHPKDRLETIEAGGKAMFVPLLLVHLRYNWDGDGAEGGSGQTARAFMIGIDRGADAKLMPFRLDSAARMYDTVSAREYAATSA